jgi:hypothetical protein
MLSSNLNLNRSRKEEDGATGQEKEVKEKG